MTLGRLEEKKMVCSYVGLPSHERGGRRRKHYLMDTAGQTRAGPRVSRPFTAMAQGIESELEGL